MGVLYKLKLKLFRKKWKKRNVNNFTYPVSIINDRLISIGKGTYGPIDVLISNENAKLTIGNYCSIASNVKFLLSGEHSLNTLSTYPYKTYYNGECNEALSKGDICIEDDVWIGYGAIILSGVTVGQGAVVAAGSVVSKNVLPYTIVGGNPAKIIRYRYSDELISILKKVDFSKLCKETIIEQIDELYKEITDIDELNSVINKLNV